MNQPQPSRRTGGTLICLLLSLSLLLSGCSTLDTSNSIALDANAKWVLLPAVNNTETPQAGERLNAITASLLRAAGIARLEVAPGQPNSNLFATGNGQLQTASLAWAHEQNARYAVYGSVQEWRYKTGLDGEPAAGVTLSILDVKQNSVVWTGSGARTGWSRESVAGVAQELLAKLVHKALADTQK